jgi:hypothetical protein
MNLETAATSSLPTSAPPLRRRVVIIAFNSEGKRIGETHPNARISDSTVDLIRELHETYGYGYLDISHGLDISLGTVGKICSYQRRADTPSRWRRAHHVDRPKHEDTLTVADFRRRLAAKPRPERPSKETILRLLDSGSSYYKIAKTYHMDPRLVMNIAARNRVIPVSNA